MSAPSGLRFGAFELDLSTGELRQRGDLVKLAAQPAQSARSAGPPGGRSGDTTQEIRDHVWSGDTFVDFEQGLNFCIRQVREGARRYRRRAAIHRDAAAARLPVPDAGDGGGGQNRPPKLMRLIVPAVHDAASRSRDRISRLQPAGRADRLARRLRIARRPLQPAPPRASSAPWRIRNTWPAKRTSTSSSPARCCAPAARCAYDAGDQRRDRRRAVVEHRRRCRSAMCSRCRMR